MLTLEFKKYTHQQVAALRSQIASSEKRISEGKKELQRLASLLNEAALHNNYKTFQELRRDYRNAGIVLDYWQRHKQQLENGKAMSESTLKVIGERQLDTLDQASRARIQRVSSLMRNILHECSESCADLEAICEDVNAILDICAQETTEINILSEALFEMDVKLCGSETYYRSVFGVADRIPVYKPKFDLTGLREVLDELKPIQEIKSRIPVIDAAVLGRTLEDQIAVKELLALSEDVSDGN